MDPLTIATSVAGLLSLALQVSQILSDQIRTVKNAPKDAQELLDELDLLRQVLSRLEAFLKAQTLKGYLFRGTSVLVNAIRGCGDQITAVKLRLEKLVRKQGFAQMIERGKWYYDHGEYQDELLSKSADAVTREINVLKSAISALTPDPQKAQAKSKQLDDILQLLSPISTITKDVAHVSESIRRWDSRWQDQETRNILNWLSPLNFWTKQDDTFCRKEEGTCQWMFEEPAFNAWLKGTERRLWCPGMPGAGKTILTSAVIDYLKNKFDEQDIGIAFVYCNYKEKEDQTTANLMASLIQQLIERLPVIPGHLRSLYDRHNRTKTRPTVAECSELLHMELNACSRAFLVVDALDECDETSGTRRDLISQLLGLPPSTHLMVTSREVPSIQQELNLFCRIEIHASDADVRTYLEGRIGREDTIVKKVKGMFLLAQLHIESLAKKHTRKAVREALEHLPKGLDATYDEAMERIYNQDEEDGQLAKKLLSWVSYSRRPLTVRELQHALAVELDDKAIDEEALLDESLMISVCAGILTIDQESNVIRLVHYTSEEYFERKRLDKFPTGQTSIAMTCLTYLSFDAFKVGCSSTDWEMEDRLEEYPLLQYAAEYWGIHATAGAAPILQSQILKFLALDSNLSCSVQAMQLPSYRYVGYSQIPKKQTHGLWVAAVFGLTETVKALIALSNNLDTKNSGGEMALQGAASAGHEAVVRLLLEKGADINAKDNIGWTALHKAASAGRETVVQLLLEKGADINAKDNTRWTALHRAASAGYKAVVQLLLEKGADINAKDSSGWTVLNQAASNGREAIVRLLEAHSVS